MKKKHKRINVILAISVILTFVFTNGTYAQHSNEHKADSKEQHDDSHGHHANKNHLSLFTGATTNFDHNTTLFTIGLDYEYRISKLFGIGLAGEYLTGEATEIVAGIPVFIHPVDKLKFIVAPLLIFTEEHSESHDSHGTTEYDNKMKSSFAVRTSVGYDFHVGKFSIGPVVSFDIGKTTAVVYGISVGLGF